MLKQDWNIHRQIRTSLVSSVIVSQLSENVRVSAVSTSRCSVSLEMCLCSINMQVNHCSLGMCITQVVNLSCFSLCFSYSQRNNLGSSQTAVNTSWTVDTSQPVNISQTVNTSLQPISLFSLCYALIKHYFKMHCFLSFFFLGMKHNPQILFLQNTYLLKCDRMLAPVFKF